MVLVQNEYKNTLVGVLRTQITFVTHSSPSCYVTLRTQDTRLNSGNLDPQKIDSGVFIIVLTGLVTNPRPTAWKANTLTINPTRHGVYCRGRNFLKCSLVLQTRTLKRLLVLLPNNAGHSRKSNLTLFFFYLSVGHWTKINSCLD